MTTFPDGFLWGASSAPHQIEGNNVGSDFWANEGRVPGMEFSGDACDSYHRYPEDMRLLADAGYTSYRFGVEWARIEPRPGMISNAELAHYRRMIDTALQLGLTPVVTLHHFTNPRWLADEGGWLSDSTVDRFTAYAEAVTGILDGVEWVATMNEPNMLAMMTGMSRRVADPKATKKWMSPTVEGEAGAAGARPQLPPPDLEVGQRLIDAHHAVRDLVRSRTGAKVGWTVANRAYEALPGGQEKADELSRIWEDVYLEAARGDDFIGVQSYSTLTVGPDGLVPHEPKSDDTLVGTPYRPDALGIAARHAWEVTGGVPILVTENGIATSDDTQRIAYTEGALEALAGAIADGIDVRGYLHWTLLDNFEWGHWAPTFGLIAVDRTTFVRTPKPSLTWLGSVAKDNGAAVGASRP
ncbi:family 1 glycosylhydrolase (plasmid) [Rathayibacter sp. VKM Ac-2803]|uniref:Beta-glucosidase n=1 Tax=Rathayibacter caricis DSM 15933 TaxID=1328867 RepID=A0A2T4UNP7_9MICO|nr:MULTISPECIES: family 1 glycosylhydrolase [Rathayibacter]MWV51555.1 family 1 glycosylhydrolase [Rathayibacter sp. VKM Ac-2803]PTL71158.1 beta-glucosidase [Rathayibacter caricis DSM 15933]